MLILDSRLEKLIGFKDAEQCFVKEKDTEIHTTKEKPNTFIPSFKGRKREHT